jgi:hypothetical protein
MATEEKVVPSKYAVLQEFNDEEKECWLTFLKYTGNEENMKFLFDQLESIPFYVIEGMSTFDLEIDKLVSEQTAKEMTNIDLNHYSFHRKFDGELKRIDFGLKADWKTSKKIRKVCDVLGYGGIENFIDKEDVDPNELVDISSSSSEEEEESSSSSSSSEDEKEKEKDKKKKGKVPPVVQNKDIPGFARAKIKHRHKKE